MQASRIRKQRSSSGRKDPSPSQSQPRTSLRCGSKRKRSARIQPKSLPKRGPTRSINATKRPKIRFQSIISAADQGDLENVQYLVKRNSECLKRTDSRGRNALHLAAMRGYLHIIQYLLAETKIDVTSTDRDGNTVLHWACIKGHRKIVDYLSTETKIVDSTDNDGSNILLWAVRRGDLAITRHLITKIKIDVNFTNNFRQNALHLACIGGHCRIVRYLLAETEIVDSLDSDGNNALNLVARFGHTETVRLLLSLLKIDVNVKDKHGRSALNSAAKNGNCEVVTVLLQSPNIDVNSQDSDGFTPLNSAVHCVSYASTTRHVDTVRILLSEENVDVNQPCNIMRKSPLHNARTGEVIELLLAHPKINVNMTDSDGKTRLNREARLGREYYIEMLLEHPQIDVNLPDSAGNTPLINSCHREYRYSVSCKLSNTLLRDTRVNLHAMNNAGKTALMTVREALMIFRGSSNPTFEQVCGSVLWGFNRAFQKCAALGLRDAWRCGLPMVIVNEITEYTG
eukprot:899463_1